MKTCEGKSNVMDAICFVFGIEAKFLRSKNGRGLKNRREKTGETFVQATMEGEVMRSTTLRCQISRRMVKLSSRGLLGAQGPAFTS